MAINGLKRNPSYIILDDSNDSLIVLFIALFTDSKQLNVLITEEFTKKEEWKCVLDRLNVHNVIGIEGALSFINSNFVGTVTDFGKHDEVLK